MKTLLLSAMSVAAFAAAATAQEFVPVEYQNSVMIEQIGTANSTIVDQTWGGFIEGQSYAHIVQSGDANTVDAFQSTLKPSYTAPFANRLFVRQGSSSWSGVQHDNYVLAEQIHDYGRKGSNSGRIIQSGNYGTVVLRQRGTKNVARVYERADAALADATVEQNGRNNEANIRIRGDLETVRVIQGTFSGPGTASFGDAFQSRVDVKALGQNATITVEQYGNGNETDVYENGVDGTVSVYSDGDYNTADVVQSNTLGQIDIQQVTGFGLGSNAAIVHQDASDEGSQASIGQFGLGGFSEIVQKNDALGGVGGYNTALATQTSASIDAESNILQDGTGNLATIQQATALASSSVIQTGSAQTANVSQ